MNREGKRKIRLSLSTSILIGLVLGILCGIFLENTMVQTIVGLVWVLPVTVLDSNDAVSHN